MITPPAPRSVYAAIADSLRRRIEAGEFPPGAPLPAEDDLSHHYEYSVTTIRRALDILLREGLIVKRHGAATRVRDTPQMTVDDAPRGHYLAARPASDAERAEWDLPPGAWVMVAAEEPGGVPLYSWPADRTWLWVPGEE